MITDGHFFFRFVQAWSAVASGRTSVASLMATIDRTCLKARSPPRVSSFNTEYTDFPFSGSSQTTKPFTTAVLRLNQKQLLNLKNRISNGKEGFTTFHIVASHAWSCICIARGLACDQEVHLSLPIQFRNLMEPPLPDLSLGNAVMRIPVTAVSGRLISDPLKFGAERIRATINKVDNENVRSLIDYLEGTDIEGLSRRRGLDATRICVISWLGMPAHDADFGWGKPVFVGRAQMYGTGFVYLINGGPKLRGGINVLVSLEVEYMEKFKHHFYSKTTQSAM